MKIIYRAHYCTDEGLRINACRYCLVDTFFSKFWSQNLYYCADLFEIWYVYLVLIAICSLRTTTEFHEYFKRY